MILVSVKLHSEGYLAHLAVHTHMEVTLLAQLLEKLLVMTFAIEHYGCKDIYLVPVVLIEYEVNNFFARVLDHWTSR